MAQMNCLGWNHLAQMAKSRPRKPPHTLNPANNKQQRNAVVSQSIIEDYVDGEYHMAETLWLRSHGSDDLSWQKSLG